MSVRRFIEDPQRRIGIAVHFANEPDAEAIAVFTELATWIADEVDAGRSPFKPDALVVQLTESEAAESADRQLQRIEELRRRAGLDPEAPSAEA